MKRRERIHEGSFSCRVAGKDPPPAALATAVAPAVTPPVEGIFGGGTHESSITAGQARRGIAPQREFARRTYGLLDTD